MKLFTTLTPTHNPGRGDRWSVQEEAVRQADNGNSLAATMLRNGYSIIPAAAVLYVRNADGLTMSDLCAAVLEGLATRRSEGGGVKPVLNGTSLDLVRMRLATIADRRASGIVLDGACRCVGAVLAFACGREDIEMFGTEATPEQAAVAEGIGPNVLGDYTRRLDPWAKIAATETLLLSRSTMTEAELMAETGVKRGDAQLMHRAAGAIKKHKLVPDRGGRCLSKEEWKQVLDEVTSQGAQALLTSLQTGVRAKALGWDTVSGALSMLAEGTLVDARLLGACKDRAALDAYLATIA